MILTDAHYRDAALAYPKAVTGSYSGCEHVEEVLRHCIDDLGGRAGALAETFVRTHHGAAWNALVTIMPDSAWIVWYNGDKYGKA